MRGLAGHKEWNPQGVDETFLWPKLPCRFCTSPKLGQVGLQFCTPDRWLHHAWHASCTFTAFTAFTAFTFNIFQREIECLCFPWQHIASPYRYISLHIAILRLQWLQETFRLPILKFIVRWSEDDDGRWDDVTIRCGHMQQIATAFCTPWHTRITWWERKLVAWRCKLHTSFSPKKADVEIQTIGLYRTIVKL